MDAQSVTERLQRDGFTVLYPGDEARCGCGVKYAVLPLQARTDLGIVEVLGDRHPTKPKPTRKPPKPR